MVQPSCAVSLDGAALRPTSLPRSGEGDSPLFLRRLRKRGQSPRAAREHAALPAVEQKIADAGTGQRLGRPIERVALADAPQIDLHAGCGHLQCAALCVELKPLAADLATGRGQFVVAGHSAGAVIEAPGFGERSAGDVVCAAAALVDRGGQLQKREQARLDLHRAVASRAIEAAHFASVAVDGQLALQAVD